MQVLFVVILLDAFYGRSPLADCVGDLEDSEIGLFEVEGSESDEHMISSSQSVRAIDATHILCKKFMYSAPGEDVHFIVGTTATVDETGTPVTVKIPQEVKPDENLPAYDGKVDVVLDTGNMTLSNLTYLAVFDKAKSKVYAKVMFPPDLKDRIPKPLQLGEFLKPSHGVTGNVSFLDIRTIMILNFSYDGSGEMTFFTLGKNNTPEEAPMMLQLPDEKGNLVKLGKYDNKDIMVKLPNNVSLCDGYKWFGVYDHKTNESFGDVLFDQGNTPMVLPADYGQNKPGYGPTTESHTSEDGDEGGRNSTDGYNPNDEPSKGARDEDTPGPDNGQRRDNVGTSYSVRTESSFGKVTLMAAMLMGAMLAY